MTKFFSALFVADLELGFGCFTVPVVSLYESVITVQILSATTVCVEKFEKAFFAGCDCFEPYVTADDLGVFLSIFFLPSDTAIYFVLDESKQFKKFSQNERF
jgi:hypothetical protein